METRFILKQRKNRSYKKKPRAGARGFGVSEGVGFEPTIRLRVYTTSNRALSTTQTSLRMGGVSIRGEGFKYKS